MSYAYESPAQRRNRREFTRFSKALTSSLPSRLAMRDAKSSIAAHNTTAYMQHADALLKSRKPRPKQKEAHLPPRFLTLLRLQIKSGKQKGQWHKTPELVELLGGYVPHPPDGVTEWRWWTALGMAFLRRHPHLHDRVRKAYEMAEYWVPDPWLIRTARDMLPPLDGSWRDFVGTEGGKAVRNREGVDQRVLDDVEAGQWQQSLKNSLDNKGYMAFTWSMGGRDIAKPNAVAHAAPGDFDRRKPSREEGSHTRLHTAVSGSSRLGTAHDQQQSRGSGSFTADAAKKMAEAITKSGKVYRTWLTDEELDERARALDRKKIRAKQRQRQHKALNMEFENFLSKPGKAFRPRSNTEWFEAKVLKVYSDGAVDIRMQDRRGEKYRHVDKKYVQIDRVALAILSAKEGIETAKSEGAAHDPISSEVDEMDAIYKARQARGGGPARRHAGIDALSAKWSKGLSVKGEDRRLSKYLADKRPEFSTRVAQSAQSKKLHRDHSDLRPQRGVDPAVLQKMRRRRKKQNSADQVLDKMLDEKNLSALEKELKSITADPDSLPEKGRETPNIAVGSLHGEVKLRRMKEKARKEREKRKKVLSNVVESERLLALSILKYEEKLEEVGRELVSAIEMHKSAALQTEMIHAFDGVTQCLNETRWITCEMIEALAEWRKAKQTLVNMDSSLASEAHNEAMVIEKAYDPLEDPDVDDMGALDAPGALPFMWNGENILLRIERGLDFVAGSTELCEWYGKHFSLHRNPFMVVTPLAQRAHTPRKFTQTMLVNGEEIEHEVPRLKELAGKAVKRLREVKDKQFNCSFWWPGHDMRPAEFERVRRAEKEITQELRREKLRNKQAIKDVQARVIAQQAKMAADALTV
eukprot:g4275.t1